MTQRVQTQTTLIQPRATIGGDAMTRAITVLGMLLAALPCAINTPAGADNLVPNSSFEHVREGVPLGWSWSEGPAKATLTMDEQVAHSGNVSLHIRNATPFAPNVYSCLRTRVPVKPETTYTLSCYVRGEDPGKAWVGGGDGWRVRIYLPAGTNEWQRLSRTFKTNATEKSFELLIGTDSPTEGFWVDSLQLEEGDQPTDYEPPLAPGELRLVREESAADAYGANLIANPSFEIVDGNRPKGWSWDKRNTDATFAVVNDGRSGKNAVRITNTTPHGAHVYGQMSLLGGLALKPGQTYTLSIYAKSDAPGAAWTGGGDGWWMRLGLKGTEGEWKRFSRTFVARDGDVNFPVLVNTDSPTDGFLVDDIKVESGAAPTPFVNQDAPPDTVELSLSVPEELSCPATEVSLPMFAYLGAGVTPQPATVTLSHADGTVMAQASTAEALEQGLNHLALQWSPAPSANREYVLRFAVGDTSETSAFELFTSQEFAPARGAAEKAASALKDLVKQAREAGVPTDYATAACAIADRFLNVAARKAAGNVVTEAVRDADTIAALCTEQTDVLKAILAGDRPAPIVPDPPLEQIQIHDGNFWVDDEPVMLVGALGYGELQQALPTYRDYGFNIIGDDFNAYSAFRMITGEDTVDETAIPRLQASWDKLREMNLAVAYNPTLHYFPEWALVKYTDITGGDPVDRLPDWSGLARHAGTRTKSYGGFFPFAIDSPNLRRLVTRYYETLIPAIKDHEGFQVIWLMNEPTYTSTDPHYVGLFRTYLRDKFGTIDGLNDAWETDFEDFNAIGYPTTAGSPAKFDWLTFHQDQVASWFEWLAGQIKRHDPDVILSNKPMAWTMLDPERGIDFEREAELWEVPGCDAGRSPGSATYSFGWPGATMLFDFQRSVAPDKPLGDHEYHYVHQANVTSEYVRAGYFQSYLHGLRMSQFWVWATGVIGEGVGGAGMKHTAWSQPKVAWGNASVALDLRRLAKYVAAFPGTPEVRIYISRPSLYLDHAAHKGAISQAYEAANGLDAPVGFITDRMIRDGKLADCRLLIVPRANNVESDVLAEIRRYLTDGGSVVLAGECLSNDEYGRPHTGAVAVSPAQVTRADSLALKALVPVLEDAMTAAGISRPIRARQTDGSPAWPVECRTMEIDGETICYLIGLNREPMELRLDAVTPIRGFEDLITGASYDGNTLTIDPLDVYLLRVED